MSSLGWMGAAVHVHFSEGHCQTLPDMPHCETHPLNDSDPTTRAPGAKPTPDHIQTTASPKAPKTYTVWYANTVPTQYLYSTCGLTSRVAGARLALQLRMKRRGGGEVRG